MRNYIKKFIAFFDLGFTLRTDVEKELANSLDDYIKDPDKFNSANMIKRVEETTKYAKLVHDAKTVEDLKPVLLFLLSETV